MENIAHRKMTNNLKGRAGVSLVEFQLGRRGFEHIATAGSSAVGDVWADTDNGKVSIEVKTTAAGFKWLISTSQTRSEFYCLINLQNAACWVVSRSEMQEAIKLAPRAHSGHVAVSRDCLPKDAHEGWHRFGECQNLGSAAKLEGRHTYKTTRRVTHKLANGSVKIYTYGPSRTEKNAENGP